MKESIERLRKSRASYVASEHKFGSTMGREWALNDAEYVELRRLSSAVPEDIPFEEFYTPENLAGIITEGNYNLTRGLKDLERDPDYYKGFYDGAVEVFEELRGEIENDPPVAPA